MANLADSIQQLNVATSAIAARLARLQNDSHTPAQIAELDAIVASLTAMGVDPADPVPVPVPVG